MLKTQLFDIHNQLGAKMVSFANYAMPIQYNNMKEEINSVRNDKGMFDVSHMGEIFVSGDDAVSFIDYIITNDFKKIPVGKAVYSPICNDEGKIIDDVICYKLESNRAMICVNAANRKKDFEWIYSKSHNFNIKLEDRSDEYSLIAIQGPNSFETLKRLKDFNLLEDIAYYGVTELNGMITARTGYTGEDGFEVFIKNNEIAALWNKLLKLGVSPCGLGARDILRLEVCYPLYGQELSENLTPLDCNLKWTVKFTKEDFIGKEYLEGYSRKYKLIKFVMDKGIPRSGFEVYLKGKLIGEVTSGGYSVSLGHGIGIARVKSSENVSDLVAMNSGELSVAIRNKQYPIKIVKNNFIEGRHK